VPHSNDIHVVVLDALMGAMGVMTQSSPNPTNLIACDRRSDACAAAHNTPISLSVKKQYTQFLSNVRKINRLFIKSANIRYFVSQFL